MTCIVGLEHEGAVYIGTDSAGCRGREVRVVRLAKVFKRRDFLIGYTTSFRMGQLLQHRLTVQPQNGESDDEYLVCQFIEGVRTCLKEGGFAKIENNVEEGGFFLVGFNGCLYSVDNDYQINSVQDGFDACGCGRAYALGALAVTNDLPPKKRSKKALSVAARFSGGVMPPFKVLKID